jgi:hypothetical protein
MDFQLSNLVDHKRIVAIDATPVPAPPDSPQPGDHLFVNCHYDASQATRPRHELLDEARADALQIVGRLAGVPNIQRYPSVVMTVYGHFPVAGASRPARRRIYRVNVLGKDLPRNGAPLTPSYFSQVHAVESSELDDLSQLLHETST